jgi:hypothetical protein
MMQVEQGGWFLRLHGELTGPFPALQIARYLLLQRLGPEHEISRDGSNWYAIREVPEVQPEKRLAAAGITAQERQLLEATRRWVEENPALFLSPGQARGVEEELALADELYHPQPHAGKRVNRTLGAGIALVLGLTVIITAFLLPEGNQLDVPQCEQPPSPGVNWNNCRLQGSQLGNSDLRDARLRNAQLNGAVLRAANLSRSDIAYTNLSLANLRGATLVESNLTGANLRGADLRNADLRGVDLRYADLSNADLRGALLDGARLDYAIWSEGVTCMPESVGRCRPARRTP